MRKTHDRILVSGLGAFHVEQGMPKNMQVYSVLRFRGENTSTVLLQLLGHAQELRTPYVSSI